MDGDPLEWSTIFGNGSSKELFRIFFFSIRRKCKIIAWQIYVTLKDSYLGMKQLKSCNNFMYVSGALMSLLLLIMQCLRAYWAENLWWQRWNSKWPNFLCLPLEVTDASNIIPPVQTVSCPRVMPGGMTIFLCAPAYVKYKIGRLHFYLLIQLLTRGSDFGIIPSM